MRSVLVTLGILAVAGTASADGPSPLDAAAAGVGKDPAALVALGDLYVEARRIDDARKAYREALKIQPKYGEAEFGLVRIDMALGRFDQAKNGCRGVARRHKAESVGEVCSGWFWLSYDRSARAIDEFQKAIAKGDIARGQTGMGEAYLRQVNHEKALEAYKSALAAGADYVAQIGMGLALEALGDRQGAIAAFQKAASQQPASCRARFNHGRALGQGPLAVSELNAAIAIRPDWAEAYHALGDVLLANQDFPGAEAAYRKAVSLEPTRGTAFLGLGRALHAQGKDQDAKTALQKAIEVVPNLADAYLILSDIQYAGGETDAALDALEKARSMAPGEVRVFLHSGETYFRLGRYTQANSFLTQAVGMQPDLSRAHVILGDIACERRLYDSGQKHYDDALKGDMVGVDKAVVLKSRAACTPRGPGK